MRRAITATAAVLIAAALLVAPPAPTNASWVDAENATGSFGAYTVPPPVITSCISSNVLGAARVTIKWRYGSTTPTPSSTFWFSSSNPAALALLPGSTTTTGPVAGEYTTVFSSGLLGALLGGWAYVGVAATQDGWTSTIASAAASIPLLIGVGNCTPYAP
jgi:hypothetical protein